MLRILIYLQEGAGVSKVSQTHLSMESFSEVQLKEPMVCETPFPSRVVFKLLKRHRTRSTDYFPQEISIYVKRTQNRWNRPKHGWDNTDNDSDNSLAFPVCPLRRYLRTPRGLCGTIWRTQFPLPYLFSPLQEQDADESQALPGFPGASQLEGASLLLQNLLLYNKQGVRKSFPEFYG